MFSHLHHTQEDNVGNDAEQFGAISHFKSFYNVVQCAGCDDVRFHIRTEDDYRGDTYTKEYLYPENQIRRMPDWVDRELRTKLRLFNEPEQKPGHSIHLADMKKFLVEIYQALGGGSHRLATMGIRALIELIMVHEVGDRRSFAKNIEAFFEKGHVAISQQEMFRNTLVEAGHAAMHRGWEPTQGDVITLLDITETLIKSLYVDSAKAKDVAKGIPPAPWHPSKRAP